MPEWPRPRGFKSQEITDGRVSEVLGKTATIVPNTGAEICPKAALPPTLEIRFHWYR